MAPPITSPSSNTLKKSGALAAVPAGTFSSREATPIAARPGSRQPKTSRGDTELASIFKADLTNIRNLVTCSICDQLLYEPWTLGCGHTYCYSCLCNWFVPNRRKKTCPECRTRVKQMPAPAFLVKQLVEVFMKRGELMPSDESIDQHKQRRAEEVADVDRDRNGPEGLFKGTFPATSGELYRDDVDGGVMRCPYCHFEHEGGPQCQNCGEPLDDEGYDFSDLDDDAELDDLDALSLDLDVEVETEFEEMHGHHFMDMPPFVHPFVHFHHHHHHHGHDEATEQSDISNSDASELNSDDDDEDDGSSLAEFVAPDDEEPIRGPGRQSNNRSSQRQPIEISDDESDEGGAVSNRIPRRRARVVIGSSSPSPSIASALTVTDSGTNDSDVGDMNSEAEMLRHAGWSPLDQGGDSDVEDQFQFRHGYGYEEDQTSDDNSDTETMVGNGVSDDEGDDRSREEMSETPTYGGGYPPYIPHEHAPNNYASLGEEPDDADSETGYSSVYDQDGDTEMSTSPRAGRGVSIDTDGYGNSLSDYPDESRSSRSISRGTDADLETNQNLGVASEIHEIDDDSEDCPIRPPPRRLPRRYHPNARVQQYDPRISMIFAEHQQSMRGAQSHQVGLDELDNEVRRVEPASRARRMTAYRAQPARRVDLLRSSRSPSATRVIASSGRASRPPRHYNFGRGYGN
ncbi:hypothetical protein G7Y89_g958 [Cudoniella acicularis]|uniref:RING-type domain-containing protein n=1 Tax=Cudoniella acicularis TaxID=354080 RepID=A0A8H4W9Y7_9HELO|nr:hypothetical protein G7Y89_g958 [Cudoniella acicularis]